MLLVVGGIKGGSGKTTIATNLAVCRASLGKRVLLIDADEQQTAMDWQAQRIPFLPITVGSHLGNDLYIHLMEVKRCGVYEEIIVDVGGRDTTSQRAALIGCDAFLAPFRPRSFDVWTLSSLRKINKEIRQVNRKFRIMAVLNQCEPRGMDKMTARTIIEENKIECLKAELGYRKAFSDASSAGLGVIELKTADQKSIQEILLLHDGIYKEDMLHTFKIDGKDIWQSLEK
jgi:chromosome partitioning protein